MEMQSLSDLIELLERGESQAEKSRTRDAVAAVEAGFLDPIAAGFIEQGGSEELDRGPVKNDPHKQFIARVRFAVPDPDDLFGPLRLGLEKRASNGKRTGKFHVGYLGVVVAHRWHEEDSGGHHAHVRWGFWTGASTGKDGALIPPFNALRKRIEDGEQRFGAPYDKQIPGIKTRGWWLTFMGRHARQAGLYDRRRPARSPHRRSALNHRPLGLGRRARSSGYSVAPAVANAATPSAAINEAMKNGPNSVVGPGSGNPMRQP